VNSGSCRGGHPTTDRGSTLPYRVTPRSLSAPPSAIAIFARAPAPGKAKTRLIPLLGAEGAARFQGALVADTLGKTNALGRRVARYLFITGGRPRGAGGEAQGRYLADCVLIEQRGQDLGERLERAFRQLLIRHPAAVIMATDSPLLPVSILNAAIGELGCCDAVLGPCPDGGYYLIGLRRLSAGILRGVRWGTRFAFRDTLESLLRRNFSCSVLEPFADVDRPEDLGRLRARLARSRAARRLAPATWRFLGGLA
jgi:uncharacterized protein